MRDLAVSILEKHEVGRLHAEVGARRGEVARLDHERAHLEGTISWWDRADVFRSTPDETRLGQVREGLERARAALASARAAADVAVGAASAEMPPLDVVRRVARCLQVVLEHPVPMGTMEGSTAELVSELEALAATVFATWAPGLTPELAVGELLDPRRVEALAHAPAAPLAIHPTWGYAPAAPDQLLAHAARAMTTPEAAAARAALGRETAEHAAATRRVRERRKAIRLTDLVVADDEGREAATRALAVPDQETHELFAASEAVQHATMAAFGALPPLRIAFAAWAAAGVIRARLLGWEMRIDPRTGLCGYAVGRRHRALLLAAHAALRDVVDETFPGLLALVAPPSVAAVAASLDAPTAGPYREHRGAEADVRGPRTAADAEAAVIARARELGLDSRFAAMIAHASMLGALRTKHRELEPARNLMEILREGRDGDASTAASRAGWHRAALHALLDASQGTIASARGGHFVFDLNGQALRMQMAIRMIRSLAGDVALWTPCPLEGTSEALAEVERMAALIRQSFGDPGPPDRLAADVAARIASTPPGRGPAGRPRHLARHDLVGLLADVLRPTRFTECHGQATSAWATHVAARVRAEKAKGEVTFWDVVNVFSESDAERVARTDGELAETSLQTSSSAFRELGRLFAEALRSYPPVALLYRLTDIAAAVVAIRVDSVKKPATVWKSNNFACNCVVYGLDAALARGAEWTREALAAFGTAPTDVDLLVRHWEGRIAARGGSLETA